MFMYMCNDKYESNLQLAQHTSAQAKFKYMLQLNVF